MTKRQWMSHISTTSSLMSCCKALIEYSTDSLSEANEEVGLETNTKVLGAEVGTGGVWVCLCLLIVCQLVVSCWVNGKVLQTFQGFTAPPGENTAFLKSNCLCFSPKYTMTYWQRKELQFLIYYQLLIPLWFTIPSWKQNTTPQLWKQVLFNFAGQQYLKL